MKNEIKQLLQEACDTENKQDNDLDWRIRDDGITVWCGKFPLVTLLDVSKEPYVMPQTLYSFQESTLHVYAQNILNGLWLQIEIIKAKAT